MNKKLLFTLKAFFMVFIMNAQAVYIDQFNDGKLDNVYYGSNYTGEESGDEWTITGNGSTGAYELFGYQPTDANGAKLTLDITKNNKVYVRCKASNLGTQLRMDIKDSKGYVTTLPGFTKTLVSEYVVFEFDFTDNYKDGGYGGTACSAGPCPVDGTSITDFQFYVSPGAGSFGGIIKIDFIAVGEAPGVGPVSSVFQDQFDSENSLTYFMGSTTPGLVNSIANSTWTITGDGSGGAYNPLYYIINNPKTLDTIDVSVTDAQDKIYVRMKASVPGTTFRLDLQDINGFITTAGSITKVVTTEYKTYEYNFNGSYSDLAYGGTACTVGPCPVDPTRIASMVMFVNPGTGAYAGTIDIDYISFGTPLEVDPNAGSKLVYGDHFSKASSFVSTTSSMQLSYEASKLKIKATGGDGPYANVFYKLNDLKKENTPISVDITGNHKMFIKVRCNTPNTLLRIDLADSLGYNTTKASFSRILDSEFKVIELNFESAYEDAGYGGTPCTAGPCPVNGKEISAVLLYPNPADGGFTGDIEIDYISFGAPMGEDVFKYFDQFEDGDKSKWSEVGGFTVEEKNKELVIKGDGTAGAYSAFYYQPHNIDTKENYILDVTSNNKIYARVKSSVAGVPMRIDLVDEGGYITTVPSIARNMTSDYSVLEFDFKDAYNDGAYGGTPCTAGPCAVDGTKIKAFLVYIDPANGKFNGTVTMDWISTIDPLEVVVEEGPEGVTSYSDDFPESAAAYISKTGGLDTKVEGGIFSVKGDGTSGAYAPINYRIHKGADSLVNVAATNNRLFVKAKSSVAVDLRVDLQDNKGYLTSLAGLTNKVTTDFTVLEYGFAGKYSDGGYGGTPCTAGPCKVDEKRIKNLQFYIAPGTGAYAGNLDIDWISFGDPLTVDVTDIDLVESGKVYPNPVINEMYLEINSKQSGAGVAAITDIAGRVVMVQDLGNISQGNNSFRISTSGLNKGLYLMNVTLDKKKAFNVKVIVE